jgi:hypothetical protein
MRLNLNGEGAVMARGGENEVAVTRIGPGFGYSGPEPATRKRRPKRLRRQVVPLTEEQILAWADAHFARTGSWPICKGGAVLDALGEKWINLDTALRVGLRGLPGGSSLPDLLAQHRGTRHVDFLPPLQEKQILAWAKAFHKRTGGWPVVNKSGDIPEAPGETWAIVQHALVEGKRGLPGGDSLPRLLARHFGVRNKADLPQLSVEEIVKWAKAHRRRHGSWPKLTSGPAEGSPGLSWKTIDTALRQHLRGLKGRSSLAQVLAQHCGVRNKCQSPPLTVSQVLAWADEHFQRTGKWPSQASGPIPHSGGETWRVMESALREGLRGLPGNLSLHQLLVLLGRKK